jgi:hypothetical protein
MSGVRLCLEIGRFWFVMAKPDATKTQQAGRIIDARGRSVSQLDPVMMHLLHRPGIIPSDALREISQQVGLGITRATRGAFWASIVGLICLGIALVICMTRLANGSITGAKCARSLIPYASVIAGLMGSWIALRSARHQKIGGAMLKHHRCPHCGYDLRMLPADGADGATVCPECGCAWRLESEAK